MTATITPVAKHTGATITRPVDGERAGMDSGPAPLATLLQDLANRAQYARGASWGNMVGGDVFSVDTGGTSTVFTVRVSAFEAMVAQDTNGVFWPRFTTGDTTFSLADVDGSPANLSNSTWYYCYVGVNTDGTFRKQISTTGPGASRIWKSGAADVWRYVGCFRTNGSGAPLPVRANRGRYVYQYSAITATGPHRVLTTGHDTSLTTVSCAAAVPPHARVARLRCQVGRSGTSGNAQLVTSGDTTNYFGVYVGSGGGTVESDVEMILDADRELDYLVDNASTACTLNVLGFDE
jgi:hypothetical protein